MDSGSYGTESAQEEDVNDKRDAAHGTTQRLPGVDPASTAGKTRELLDGVQRELGMVPNLIRAMAVSPTVLEAYLSLHATLTTGTLPVSLRERIALTVAELNRSAYCLAAHAAVGKTVGLSDQEIQDSRAGTSPVRRVEAALIFTRRLITEHGAVTDDDVVRLHDAGYRDDEIAEVVALVALNIWTNYFNNLAGTEIDYPAIGRMSRRLVDGDGKSELTEAFTRQPS